MGVCGTPWHIVDAATIWPRIAHRIPGPPSMAADIRHECDTGAALCMQCHDGMLVLALQPSGNGLNFRLFVLLCVGYVAGAFQRRDADLDSIAADLGATEIAMRPARRGWVRLLGPQWIRQGDVYSRRVTHGGETAGREANTPAAGAG